MYVLGFERQKEERYSKNNKLVNINKLNELTSSLSFFFAKLAVLAPILPLLFLGAS